MWSETYILARAKEFVRVYGDESGLTLNDVRAAFEQFCSDSRVFFVSTVHTTVANRREYGCGRVLWVRRVLYGGRRLRAGVEDLPGVYRVDAERVILGFEPAAGVELRIEGYGVPGSIGDVSLEPELELQDAVAYLTASRYLMRYGDAQAVSRANVYSAVYLSRIEVLRSRRDQGTVERGFVSRRSGRLYIGG